MADTPAPTPTDAPSLAKPSAPAAEPDPPGIAASMMKKDGAAPGHSDTADKARLEEELEGLDNLPTAAGES